MENVESTLAQETKEKTSTKVISLVVEMIIYVIVSILIILLVRTFLIQQVKVSGTSMEPALVDKQHLFIEKVSYKLKGVKRFDIIVFQPYPDNDDLFYIKRVIGLPGEKVRIENNNIYINDVKLHENYGGNTYTDAKLAKETIYLDDDDYFVLGDNREVSKDSREKEIGLLNKASIVGKAWVSIFPFSEWGIIK